MNHLVILVHGLHGTPTSCEVIKNELQNAHPNIIIHVSTCNATTLFSPRTTHDGIDVGGERLAKEVRQVLQNNLNITTISFIGISLGGLYIRYALGLLLDLSVIFLNFITFATPHIGIRNHIFFEEAIYNGLIGKTGLQLMLADEIPTATLQASQTISLNAGDNPLLTLMSHPESIYVTALKRFGTRILIANTINDDKVPYYSGAIRYLKSSLGSTDDFKENKSLYNDLYPHIVSVSITDHEPETETEPESQLESLMIKNLREGCPFINVDVRFDEFGGIVLNHTRIACTNKWVTSIGTDVVRFVAHYIFIPTI